MYYVMDYKDKYISSIEDYLDWISLSRKTDINNNKSNFSDGLSNVYYRGQACISWEITASIFREPYKHNDLAEHKLLNEASAQLWNKLSNFTTHLEKLIYLQHYGMATRLLDVTYNPLIALYFACCSDDKCDGAIYSGVKYEKENPKIAELTAEFIFTQVWTNITESLNQYSIEKGVQLNDFLEPLFIYPPINNPRLKSQKGAFIMCPLIKDTGDNIIRYSDSLDNSPFFGYNRAIVLHEKKTKLLKSLHILGIDKGNVYQDLTSILYTIMQIEKWNIEKTNNLLYE